MQHSTDKFKIKLGKILKQVRENSGASSLNSFARQYDIDRGNLSKIERGIVSCSVLTAWRITEAAGIKFSDFAKMLEKELGKDFKLIDD